MAAPGGEKKKRGAGNTRPGPLFLLLVPNLVLSQRRHTQQLATLPRINEFVFASMGWIEAAIDDGQDIPAPSHIETLHVVQPEFSGWLWALVKVDPAMLDDIFERMSIRLPRRVLRCLDARARSAGATRSGFAIRLAVKGRVSSRA